MLTITEIKRLSLAEARALYRKEREIALKRIKRLEASEFKDASIVRRYKNSVVVPPSRVSRQDIAFALRDVQRFNASKMSTVRGQRAYKTKAIKELRRQGYNVTDQNYSMFLEILTRIQSALGEALKYNADRLEGIFNRYAERADKYDIVDEVINEYRRSPHS